MARNPTAAMGRTADDQELARLIQAAARVLVAMTARSLAQIGEDISIQQYRSLVILHTRGTLRPGELAEALTVSRSSATRLCDRLELKGLISRNREAGDRREVTLALTGVGRNLVERVMASRLADVTQIVEGIPPRQRPGVLAGFRAFDQVAREMPNPDWISSW